MPLRSAAATLTALNHRSVSLASTWRYGVSPGIFSTEVDWQTQQIGEEVAFWRRFSEGQYQIEVWARTEQADQGWLTLEDDACASLFKEEMSLERAPGEVAAAGVG